MHELFIAGMAVSLAALYAWAFRRLPRDRWQFIGAAVGEPAKTGWHSVNLTWYGFFAASAYAAGCGLLTVLLGAVGVPAWGAILATAAMMVVCVPASSLIARWVEGSRHGFTVGGASFAGLCVAPLVFGAMDAAAEDLGFETPVTACFAALSIAYVLGEGVGRLACISFGCCYGKPIAEVRGWVRRFSRRYHFVFTGATKKIAFASGLEGVPVVPVQAMTAMLYGLVALGALWLYFEGLYGWVIALVVATSQAWRVYSETIRADYRGSNRITAYQVMAAIAGSLSLLAPFVLSGGTGHQSSLANGLAVLWQPESLVWVQVVWITLFLVMGRSRQTGGHMHFHVHHDRI